MFKMICLASSLLCMSVQSQAALISHYGYQRDSATNIVKGGGLDWLMWDATKGMSVLGALDTYSGWQVASRRQMVSLFNAFKFGRDNWDETGKYVAYNMEWTQDESSPHQALFSLFGYTYQSPESSFCTGPNNTEWCYVTDDGEIRAYIAFADPESVYYSAANISDDFKSIAPLPHSNFAWTDHHASLISNYYYAHTSHPERAIALVRPSSDNANPVNSPASLSLLGLGLLALSRRRLQTIAK